jgi:AcrR family transcriptional regulator
MDPQRPRPNDLREACITEALSIIERSGIESLSLREVARRLGVSHQAPYRHFESREHMLAEVVARAFEGFAVSLDSRQRFEDPIQDFRSMGEAFLAYARAHPTNYRLMFGTPLPDMHRYPDMLNTMHYAFTVLRSGVARLPMHAGRDDPAAVTLDALFVWAAVHGLSSLAQMNTLASLRLPEPLLAAFEPYAMGKIGVALMTPLGPPPEPRKTPPA